jgi:hypothetical protein
MANNKIETERGDIAPFGAISEKKIGAEMPNSRDLTRDERQEIFEKQNRQEEQILPHTALKSEE